MRTSNRRLARRVSDWEGVSQIKQITQIILGRSLNINLANTGDCLYSGVSLLLLICDGMKSCSNQRWASRND